MALKFFHAFIIPSARNEAANKGEQLWQYTLPAAANLRGLDDIALPEDQAITAGLEQSGDVVVLNRQGSQMWQTSASGGLRRLRSFPLGGAQNCGSLSAASLET